ncbi:uncharacterized protein MAM_06762 [Metarhizium album ARSEF 1941]|uniref:Uncharacterized protein n=1 Tax=Metarhizium album (strain ARSEF 1941) TaxID=1081103 RepID=A0A0B2WR82_METAS|nr:uncharacterized protein MAM_06762 [Metarhizium album ARSEF 1941]KHN95485.1 hypothetical protein MAM_06762 [Metarhizium album ARSEF 1941]
MNEPAVALVTTSRRRGRADHAANNGITLTLTLTLTLTQHVQKRTPNAQPLPPRHNLLSHPPRAMRLSPSLVSSTLAAFGAAATASPLASRAQYRLQCDGLNPATCTPWLHTSECYSPSTVWSPFDLAVCLSPDSAHSCFEFTRCRAACECVSA